MNKLECRKKAHQILMSISSEEVELKSSQLSKKLYSFLSSNQSITSELVIGVFSPIQKEPIWFKEFKDVVHQFSLPHVIDEERMSFYCLDLQTIKSKKLGISLEAKYLESLVVPDLLIIPGLAFGRNGERLGRGKGYYDRYLNQFQGLKIGVCFEDQIMERVPMEEFDQSMDYIITNKDIYDVKGI